MKTPLVLSLVLSLVAAADADTIQVSAQCTGAPVREVARERHGGNFFKPLAKGASPLLQATLESGKSVTLEMVRTSSYPTKLEFPRADGGVIKPKERATKDEGISVELTATRDGDVVQFHANCTIRRLASVNPPSAATPADKPNLWSTTFITRECVFTGRTPFGKPAVVNLGEEGVDTGTLTLTFARAK